MAAELLEPVGGLEVIGSEAIGQPRPTSLLFVHGAWHGAWCWAEHFLPFFAEAGYPVRALSLRGHGGSGGRERLRWTRLDEYVADGAAVASTLPGPPLLVAHSMGGAVAQRYLERHRAAGMVLLAPVPPHGAALATLRAARPVCSNPIPAPETERALPRPRRHQPMCPWCQASLNTGAGLFPIAP
jgi:pimeloyl-ACP methyl ester carboxylesterase